MRCKKVNYGKLIIILGISAVGKTYFKEYLTEKYDLYKLKKVVTREKRKVEKNNTEINISEKEFKDMIKDDEFFIYTKIYNNYYGYLNSDLKKVEEGAFAIGDCYYKLLSELKRTLKEKLIVICIQPYDIEKTKKKIREERQDYIQRILGIDEEYHFYEQNKDKIDYFIYNDYSKNTEKEICKIMDKILYKGRRNRNG